MSGHHYTPVNKHGVVSDVDNLSDKFTLDGASVLQVQKSKVLQNFDTDISAIKTGRRTKIQAKEQAKIRKSVGLNDSVLTS